MPREGIDWQLMATIEDKVEALNENTNPYSFVMVVHPADEETVRRKLRSLGSALEMELNDRVPVGFPILQGCRPQERSTGKSPEQLSTEDIARRFYEVNWEIGEKFLLLDDSPPLYEDLNPARRHVMEETLKYLFAERVLFPGVKTL